LLDPVMGVHHHTAQYNKRYHFFWEFWPCLPLFLVTYLQLDLSHRIFEMFWSCMMVYTHHCI
jgi:hypothetical protein